MKLEPKTMKFAEKVITDVFNYYNGKINVINPATLRIIYVYDYAHYNGELVCGSTYYPNLVVINPLMISEVSNDINDFILHIIETIIHELYHVDQNINISTLAYNGQYREVIENQVEWMTKNYVLCNINEICNLTNNIIDPADIRQCKVVSFTNLYKRTDVISHIAIGISDMIGMDYNIIYDLLEKEDNVILKINRIGIYIKKSGETIPIQIYNQFTFDNYYKFDTGKRQHKIYADGDKVFIEIQIEGEYIMCEVVK